MKIKFSALPIGGIFLSHGHTYERLPDVWAKNNSDGKAGRAKLLKVADGVEYFGGRKASDAVGMSVVINSNKNVETI